MDNQNNNQKQHFFGKLKKQVAICITIAIMFTASNSLKAQPILIGVTNQGGNGYGTILNYTAGATSINSVYAFTNNLGKNPRYSAPIQANDGLLYDMTIGGGTNGVGVIYNYNPVTNTSTKKLDLVYSQGGYPDGSLIQASDGKMYGMTEGGGAKNLGVIFQYDPFINTYTKKIDLKTIKGKLPTGSLIQASNGMLYGMTSQGGANNVGVIFQYDIVTSRYIKKINLISNQGSTPYASLFQASDGNLYGMTFQGGANGAGVIFQYDPISNTYTKKIDLNSSIGSYPLGNLMQASDGMLYGMTQNGGINNLGVIFQYDYTTNIYTKKVDLSTTLGSKPKGSLMQASDGMLYGMTYSGGTNNLGVVFQYDPNTNTYTKKIDLNSTIGGNPFGSFVEFKNCAGITAGGSTTFCIGGSVTLTASSGASYLWSNGATTQVINVTASDTLSVIVDGVASCASLPITVISPKPSNLTTTNITASGATANWVTVSCAIGYTFKYRVAGGTWVTVLINNNTPTKSLAGLLPATNYEWRVRSKFTGGNKSSYSAIKNFTTLALREGELAVKNTLNLFPNPTSGTVTVTLNDCENCAYQLNLYDVLGHLVFTEKSNTDGNSKTVDLTSLAKGIYQVQVLYTEQTSNCKLVVQ